MFLGMKLVRYSSILGIAEAEERRRGREEADVVL
jgi:hypothetical protein